MLGGTPALRRMIDEAHARGIRVVLDGVFNHASRGFFQFHDIMENGPNSAYLDWFTVKEFPLNAYDSREGAQLSSLVGPARPAQVQYRLPGGARVPLGNRPEVDRVRHRRLAARRPQRDRRRRLLARVPRSRARRQPRGVHRRRGLDRLAALAPGRHVGRRDELSVHPRLHRLLHRRELSTRTTCEKTSLFPVGPSTAEAFRRKIERLLGLYHPNVSSVMLNLLGSHDMARFVTLAHGDKSALRLATLFQMTYPGAPSIYYGDEIGMTGGHDPANRGPFPGTSPNAGTRELLHEFQRLIALRRQRPASAARLVPVPLGATDVVIAVARQLDEETAIVVFNASRETRRLDLPVAGLVADETVLAECWGHESARVEQGTLHELVMRPRSGRVLITPGA